MVPVFIATKTMRQVNVIDKDLTVISQIHLDRHLKELHPYRTASHDWRNHKHYTAKKAHTMRYSGHGKNNWNRMAEERLPRGCMIGFSWEDTKRTTQ